MKGQQVAPARRETAARPGAAAVVLLAAALLGATLLGACGFQLQGRTPLPRKFAATWVEADDAQSDFNQGLRKALLDAGATLLPSADGASAVIHVVRDQLEQRVLSVSSRNIPQEYELTYHIRFSVEGAGIELLAANEISATRDYTFDETQVLAKEREEEILRAALARDLVVLVMRRISSL
jgi:LPS-assembly lipoprotein